jgi:molybdenum cofactor cytidylyltransferase
MGRPKLILPVWGVPLIARVVVALREGGADRVVVVAPPPGEPGGPEVARAAAGSGAEVVVPPETPDDMRASVELGLAYLARGLAPSAILLTPGDVPELRPNAVARLIRAAGESPRRIIVPRLGTRRGHPILIPWRLAAEIPRLPTGLGVNALLGLWPDRVETLDLDDPGILGDLDTPEEYRLWYGGSPPDPAGDMPRAN